MSDAGITSADVVAIARAAGERLRVEAADRDRERRFPPAELAELKRTPLLGLVVPREWGGLGADDRTLCAVLGALAEGDPNVAQMYLIHSYGVMTINAMHYPDAAKERINRRIAAGAWVTNAFSETSGKTVADYSVKLRRGTGAGAGGGVSGDWLVSGTKAYCTGSLAGDLMYVLGVTDDPQPEYRIGIVETSAPGVRIVDDWSAMGQRTTASGTTVFEDAAIPDDLCSTLDHVNVPDSVFGSVGQLMFSAILAGIARNALADAVGYVQTKSRPWIASGVDRAADDPYVVSLVGEMQIRIAAAEGALELALVQREATLAALSPATRDLASVAAGQAKALASEAALRNSEQLFQVCGTGAVLGTFNYDRHWRNARTLTLHDPVSYKLRLVGDWLLNGASPPISVYT